MTTKILIAENEVQSLYGAKALIEMNTDFPVDFFLARNGKEALQILRKNKVDVLITDLSMEPVDGWELAQKVRKKFPEIHIIISTGRLVPEDFEMIITLNVSFVYKDNGNPDDLSKALAKSINGDKFTSSNIIEYIDHLRKSGSKPMDWIFSDDEKKMIICFANGIEKNEEIADQLYLSARTVIRRRKALLKKCDVQTEAELIAKLAKFKLPE